MIKAFFVSFRTTKTLLLYRAATSRREEKPNFLYRGTEINICCYSTFTKKKQNNQSMHAARETLITYVVLVNFSETAWLHVSKKKCNWKERGAKNCKFYISAS